MATRAPQDVDLEDRLVFNLTPLQFGYLVVGVLAAGIVWKLPWAAAPVRLVAAVPLALAGVALAWGRWSGRGLDGWVADAWCFACANVRVRWVPGTLRGGIARLRWRRRAARARVRGPAPARPPRLPAPHHVVEARR